MVSGSLMQGRAKPGDDGRARRCSPVTPGRRRNRGLCTGHMRHGGWGLSVRYMQVQCCARQGSAPDTVACAGSYMHWGAAVDADR